MRRAASLVLLFFSLPAILAGAAPPDVKAIVEKLDRLYRGKSSYSRLDMAIQTPDWTRTLKLKAWSNGMGKTFITILEPKKDQGVSTLKVGSEMWNYFPRISKVMKVPPSMMMGSWMGSDFTNDDLVKWRSLADDYEGRLLPPAPGESGLLRVELVPRAGVASVWGRILATVREMDSLPIKQEFYDEHGRAVRILHFREIRDMGGRSLPTVLELVPLSKTGRKTTITYHEIVFDIPVDNDIFSLRNLERTR